ncbi:MAG: hypothetical protein CMP23_07605 [Rickettsiales bacterium]|nr:hypothetical protein [Rickettsiales bacterium]
MGTSLSGTIKAILLISSPLWGPVALLVAMARMCADGLLLISESYLGRPLELPAAVKGPFAVLALLLFPLFITLETVLSFMIQLGGLPGLCLTRLRGAPAPDEEQTATPLLVALLLSPMVVLLAPIWLPATALWWILRHLVYRLAVLPLSENLLGSAELPSRSTGRFETFVALRYMRGRKASTGVSLVTGLTIAGVTLGVWALVVVLSVMAGFEKDLQDKILGANSHVVVLSYENTIENWNQAVDRIRQTEGVTGVTPFVYSEYMLRSQHTVIGAIFKAVDPETVAEVTDLVDNITLGPEGAITSREQALELLHSMDRFQPPQPEAATAGEVQAVLPGLVIGKEMAATLRVTVGDTVQAVSPRSEPGPLGGMAARVVPFRIMGIFHSGMYEYDTKFSYASLHGADRFMSTKGAVTGIEVRVEDIYQAPVIARQIATRLDYPFWTRDWEKMNAPLFAALKLEKVVMGVILTFIIAVAAMNIISTLIMLVIEKRREIAILKAMGGGRLHIMKLFMVDGLLVGFIGTVLGLILGLVTCAALARWQFIKLESDVYYVDTLPVEISLPLCIAVAVTSISISFLATILPSWEGSSLDPVEGLRDG